MDFFTALKDTPIPTLLVIGGFIFLFLGIATIKKPIVIDVTPSSRKMALLLGVVLTGAGLYLLTQQPSTVTPDITATATITSLVDSSSTATSFVNSTPTAGSTPDILLATSTPLSTFQSGFENNCINSDIWTPYTVITSFPQSGNCWNMASRGISANNNQLLFAVENSSQQSGSIYMALPRAGNISFSVQIDQLKIGEPYADLVFGLGNSDSWLQAGRFIFLRMTKPNAPIAIVYGTDVTRSGEKVIDSYQMGELLNISFEINDLVLNIFANDVKVVDSVLLSESDKQVFWIGYRLPINARLLAFISDFNIEEK
jgi:hypothetical protein